MPFIEPQTLGERRVTDPVETPETSTADVFHAAFAMNNSVVSLIDRGKKPDFDLTPLSPELKLGVDEYDPYNETITGYEDFAGSFVDSKSQAETEWIKSTIDREKEHRETLASGGGVAIAASITAGLTEPILLPLFFLGGGAVNATRSATVAGLRLGSAVGAGVAVTEAALHGTQETRTIEESAINIGAAALISGVLGSTIQGMSRSQIAKATKAVNEDLQPVMPPSVGAAAVHKTTLEQETLIKAAGLEKVGMTPDVRLSNSPSLVTRQLKDDLLESALRKEKNLEGIPTGPEGGAVETRIKQYDRVIGESITLMDDAYIKYRTGQAGLGAKMRVKAGDLLGARSRSGQLTAKEFREEAGRALRRGDTHSVKEIDELAKKLRSGLFDPIKNKAIAAKLLPEDIKAKTAPSYLTRVWKPEVVKAKRAELNETIASWMVSKNPKLDPLEAQSTADEIINNILGFPEGKIPLGIVGKAGPLHERVLLIPDNLIEDFLENDIEVIARYYTRTMAPDIELTARFGSKDMKDQIAAIRTDYTNKIGKIKGKGAAAKVNKLNKAMEADVRDMEAMRDILSGNYGRPTDPSATFYRASSAVRKVNFLSKLGGMTISSQADMANHVFAHGLKPFGKAFAQLVASPKNFKEAAKQVKQTGAAWDMVLNTRALSLAELGDSYGRHSVFERALQNETNRFGLVSLMAPWNAAQKQFAGIISSNETLDIASKWAKGVAPNRHSLMTLTNSGIDEGMAKRIAKMFAKFGDNEAAGLRLPNAQRWTDTDAAQAFRASVLKQVDEIIVTPGAGDRPLFMQSSEAGRHIGQFKTFMFAATNKVAIARMQQRDAEALNGMILSVALGSLVYAEKQMLSGREVSSDPALIIKEGVDRSGITGWVMDANNMVEKFSGNRMGMSAMLGGQPASRYASRNMAGALAGPTFGTVNDILTVLGSTASGDFNKQDLHALRKIAPYQNLFYIRQLLNGLEEDVAGGLEK